MSFGRSNSSRMYPTKNSIDGGSGVDMGRLIVIFIDSIDSNSESRAESTIGYLLLLSCCCLQ
jgi:hypothetical protein